MKLHTDLGLLLCSGSAVLGQLHHLIVGGFGSGQLYTVEFNEQDSSLTLLNNITTGSRAHFWIALDVSVKGLSASLSFGG